MEDLKKYKICQSQGKGRKVIIHEPFPAINTTNSFECDERTANIITGMFMGLSMKAKGYSLMIEDTEKDEVIVREVYGV